MVLRTAISGLIGVTAAALLSYACSGTDNAPLGGGYDSGRPPDGEASDVTVPPDGGGGGDVTQDRNGGSDSGGTDSPVGDTGAQDGEGDAPPPYDGGPLNECTEANFMDLTDPGATREINFPGNSGQNLYEPSCVRIKVNQDVTWLGDFTQHPLEPFGGSPGNPIVATSTGTSYQQAFAVAGTFGFHCMNHTTMLGAVRVEP
jgi:plastocyanin